MSSKDGDNRIDWQIWIFVSVPTSQAAQGEIYQDRKAEIRSQAARDAYHCMCMLFQIYVVSTRTYIFDSQGLTAELGWHPHPDKAHEMHDRSRLGQTHFQIYVLPEFIDADSRQNPYKLRPISGKVQ